MKWSRSVLLSYSKTKYDIEYEVKTTLEEFHIGKESKCTRKVRKPTRRGRRAGKKKVCELYQQRNTQESEYRSIPVRITDRTYGGFNRDKALPVRPQYICVRMKQPNISTIKNKPNLNKIKHSDSNIS